MTAQGAWSSKEKERGSGGRAVLVFRERDSMHQRKEGDHKCQREKSSLRGRTHVYNQTERCKILYNRSS